jgi:hypothetical protein
MRRLRRLRDGVDLHGPKWQVAEFGLRVAEFGWATVCLAKANLSRLRQAATVQRLP